MQFQVVLVMFAFFMALSLAGCGPDEAEIEWQLPLEKGPDPHSGNIVDPLPKWAMAQHGTAHLIWLEKSTTRRHHITMELGEAAKLAGWDIRLLGLASGLRIYNNTFLNDKNVDNPAAFVEISKGDQGHYRGWLYQEFPELFGMDDPGWKVWLKGITLRPPSNEGDNLLP